MKRYALISIHLLFTCLATGCGGGQSTAESQLVAKVADLQLKQEMLQADLSKLRTEQLIESSRARLQAPQEMVWFDPQDEQAYQTVRAPAGPILVVLEKMEPYLDGFTVYMRLGNPTSAAYSGLNASVNWGRKYDISKDDNYNQVTEKKIELKSFLASGSWTVVKFNIAPATPNQARRIGFAPVFNNIQMRFSPS